MRHGHSDSGSAPGSSLPDFRRLWLACLVAAALALVTLPGPATAQSDLGNVAVLNTERAHKESSAFISLNQQMQDRSAYFQDEFLQIQNQLQEEEQRLEQQRTLLSNEAFQEQVQAFQARVNEAQRGVNERKRVLDELYGYGREQIMRELGAIVQQLAQERGYRLVLNWARNDTMVIYADPSADITDEVIVLLNERLPDIALPQSQ